MSEHKIPNESSDNAFNQQFWDTRYTLGETGWDLGEVSPPIKEYIDQLSNKQLRILIPGCGNTYEAEYLLYQGFTDVTVIDISPTLIDILQHKFSGNDAIKIVLGDFFEHKGEYDLIIEQTFFCALDRTLRESYCNKMYSLLGENGKLVGLLFNKEFEKQGPPFGGCEEEYRILFSKKFDNILFAQCYNSYFKRSNTEFFTIFKKKKFVA